MKNGTSSAVLVHDLLATDGPYAIIADDFWWRRCSFCTTEAAADMRFSDGAYLCPACLGPVARVG